MAFPAVGAGADSSSALSACFASPARAPPSSPSSNPACDLPFLNASKPCLRWCPPNSLCRYGHVVHAKRKANVPTAVEDDQMDEEFRASLNEVSTEAVKVMLSEDRKRVQAFIEKLDYLEDFLGKEGNSDAALFILVLRGMLDHKVLPQLSDLKGTYKKAFSKIFGLLEDSGWLLKADDAEMGVRMVDDELIPPVLQSQY